jgi:hypothetical protein
MFSSALRDRHAASRRSLRRCYRPIDARDQAKLLAKELKKRWGCTAQIKSMYFSKTML